MNDVVSRSEARQLGLAYYFTGKPCVRGHLSKRFVSSCTCIQCRNEATPTRVASPRLCPTCCIVKDPDEFGNARGRADGKKRQCKVCSYAGSKEYRQNYTTAWRRKNPERWMWQTTKDRAKKKGIEFNLQPSDIVIPTVCPILGIPITSQIGGKISANSASIDRVDNERGYLKDNIIIVSWRANRIKSDASLSELRSIVSFYEKLL